MEAISEIVNLALTHQWIPLAAAVIFVLVRVLKSPKIPLIAKIPPKLRTLIAVVLGFVGAGLQSFATGVPWQQALAENLIACLVAVLGHDLIIEWLRGGRELFAPPKE